jgi:hypothetical protein
MRAAFSILKSMLRLKSAAKMGMLCAVDIASAQPVCVLANHMPSHPSCPTFGSGGTSWKKMPISQWYAFI